MKYWILINHQLQGPFDKAYLRELPEFRLDSQVCIEGDDVWQAAKLLPDLTNPEASPPVLQSGDYRSVNPVAGRRVEDWREAIIPTHFEEAKTRVSAPPPSGKTAPETASAAGSLSRVRSSSRKLLEIGRSTRAMMALWTVFFGLYIPKTGQVDQIVDGLIANSYLISAPNRMLGHRPGAREKRLRSQKAKVRPGTSVKTTPRHAAKLYKDLTRSESVMEEDSAYLGSGMEMKTVVTVEEKNGQKTWKTHRYLRAKPGAGYEPM